LAFRAQTRITSTRRFVVSTRRFILIVAASLALACLSAASRAQPDEACARTTRQQQQQQQTPTPTPAQSPSPTPTPTESPTQAPSTTPTPTPADEDVERIESDLTNVLLSATDKNRRFVTTLTAEDLRLLEDGAPQQITSFQRETDAPLSIALLVDLSSSQAGVLPEERDAARAFIASVLKPQDRASVLTFTGLTRLDQPPTAERPRLEAAIDAIKPQFTEDSPECSGKSDVPEEVRIRCYTAVWDSIALTIREVLSHTPERTRRAIILLTDGEDTKSRLRVYDAVAYAVRNNTVVYAIGIRDPHVRDGMMRRDLLREVSEQTGGRAFFPRKPKDLAAAFEQIEQELRSQYLLSYTSTNRTKDGSFRKVQLEITDPRLRKQNLRLMYRQGYYAKQTRNDE
jgi:Ca-activated chloride channel homolog